MLAFTFANAQDNPSRFFDASKLIETGVYYYPEAWDSAQWDRDFANMASMGFEFTHFAEFAWAFIEPVEGVFDFAWLDKAVALASKHGLKVIMCTPTATPPAWLTQKYPEVLVVNESGLPAEHGTREHYSWSSARYRELTRWVVSQMASHYANDKRIWGWQIDNEPSHYGTVDYGPEAKQHFISWLKKKYVTIDKLNKLWGTAFWSGVYNNFEQIELPSPLRLISGIGSPHSLLDFKRFNADECADYVSFQYSTLKSIISSDQFITSNFMNFHPDVDPWRNSDLDFISYTMYPVAGYTKGMGDQGFRLGDFWKIPFANDFFRPLKGITGVMELQPGQVNWGTYNPQPYPGAVHAWLWTAFSGNLSFICSYRFRQPLFGGEQYHYGMVGTDGITPSVGGMEYSNFMKEIKQLRSQYDPNAKNPKDYEDRRTGVLFNLDNLWATDIQKQTYLWSFADHFSRIYAGLKSLAVPVDIVSEDANFSKYKVLVAPAYQLVDKALVDKWTNYVQNGGNLVLTCRTGQKDRTGILWQAPWADPISGLIGGNVKFYDVLASDVFATVKAGNNSYKWNNWGDVLEPASGTEVWAAYADQFYAGKASVTYHKLGNGSVTYIGTDSEDGTFERDMLKKVFAEASLKTVELPAGVVLEYRNGFGIAINYNSIDCIAPVPANAKILVGDKNLKPAGVVVWKE